MSDEDGQLPGNDPRAETPQDPAYDFNAPGASVALYEGPIAGVAAGERPGRIELNCGPRVGLRWHVDLQPGDHRPLADETELVVRRGGQDWPVDAHERSLGEGWINAAAFPRPNARLQRVLVQWMNLPNIDGQIILTTHRDGTPPWWRGRWRADVEGWHLTLDVRPDYADTMAHVHDTYLYVFTHVMEIRRTDQGEFDIDDVESLLDCLRVTFSFAFGRWVAPVLPVGYDPAGDVAWEQWTSPICDPATTIGSPPLDRGRPDDLTELLRCAIPAFNDTARSGNTRFQMSLAIQAVESGFVEQRILAAAPALEHLAWSALVLSKRWTKKDYNDRTTAADQLRYVLQLANVPTDIDATALPALATFAQTDRMDGPTAVTRVRNRLVHPTKLQDRIYRHDGLVQDAWHLSRRYVTLLLLHSIGYQGEYLDPASHTGWVGTAPVPWNGAGPIPTPAMPPGMKTGRRPKRRLRKLLRRLRRVDRTSA